MPFPFTVIKKFKDEIKGLKNILNVIKITRVNKRTRNKWNKKKIKYARWWDKRYLRKIGFRFNGFRTKILKTTWLWRKNRIKAISKQRINEIKRLNEEVKNNKDELLDNLLDNEKKFFELLKDLEYEKHDALHNVVVLEPKLIKLGISSERLDRIKNLVLSS